MAEGSSPSGDEGYGRAPMAFGAQDPWSHLPPPPQPRVGYVPPPGRFRRSSQIARVLSTVVAAGAIFVIVWTSVTDVPITGSLPFVALLLTGLIIGFGQLRLILAANDVVDRQRAGRPRPAGWRARAQQSTYSLDDLFDGLGRPLGWLLGGVCAFAAVFTFINDPSTPATTPGRCYATLSEGGESRCVDPEDLERYQAGGQRDAAAFILIFSAVHAGAAHATVRRIDGEAVAGPAA